MDRRGAKTRRSSQHLTHVLATELRPRLARQPAHASRLSVRAMRTHSERRHQRGDKYCQKGWMSPDSLMEIVNGRSMKQETLDAAPRIENPRPSARGVRQRTLRFS